jgi:predicted TIM-barrel fold metal-dependent hydrolase
MCHYFPPAASLFVVVVDETITDRCNEGAKLCNRRFSGISGNLTVTPEDKFSKFRYRRGGAYKLVNC